MIRHCGDYFVTVSNMKPLYQTRQSLVNSKDIAGVQKDRKKMKDLRKRDKKGNIKRKKSAWIKEMKKNVTVKKNKMGKKQPEI